MPKQKDDPEELAALGARIASARIHKGLTQKELCQRLPSNMDPQNLSKIENGGQAPSVTFIRELCNELEVSADYVARGKSSAPEKEMDPELLWESGVQRRIRELGGRVNAVVVRLVRESRLGKAAKRGQPFETREQVDAAVAEEWFEAEKQIRQMVSGAGAAAAPTVDGKATVLSRAITELRAARAPVDEGAMAEISKMAASGEFKGANPAQVRKLVEGAYDRIAKRRRK